MKTTKHYSISHRNLDIRPMANPSYLSNVAPSTQVFSGNASVLDCKETPCTLLFISYTNRGGNSLSIDINEFMLFLFTCSENASSGNEPIYPQNARA